jgi:hypothetical protein
MCRDSVDLSNVHLKQQDAPKKKIRCQSFAPFQSEINELNKQVVVKICI